MEFINNINVSVAVDPVVLITTECITVTSAMRKHTRWAHSSVSAILGAGARPLSPNSRNRTPRDTYGSRKPKAQSQDLASEIDERELANRWGLRGKKGRSTQDNPLMAGFGRLRRQLTGCKDIHRFDAPSLLDPFLQVIQASATSAPITSLALIAITKFFAYNFIGPDSPRLAQAMRLLSDAITHCRFEASDSAADEIVLLRILKLMEGILSGPGGDLLSDESVCEMIGTGLSMCCQSKLSELLRRSAEISIIKMTQIIFERLKYLEVTPHDASRVSDDKTAGHIDDVNTEAAVDEEAITTFATNISGNQSPRSPEKSRYEPNVLGRASPGNDLDPELSSDVSDDPPIKPYSLPSIREIFRVLVDLLDPHDRQHTDTMRVMALRIIDVVLEVAGPSIAKHPTLATLARDRLCRYLFQLVRSDNIAIMNESLIISGTLLATCRGMLKLQQELFLSHLVACLHPRIEIPSESGIDPSLFAGVSWAPKTFKHNTLQGKSERSTPLPVKDRQKLGMESSSRKPDAKEAMVESIGALVRIPSYMAELFINYDCDIDRGDLCEELVGLLSRNSFPDSATWSTSSVPPLCLEALLGYIQFISRRLDHTPQFEGYPDRNILREQRKKKKVIIEGASKFNEKPRAGLEFLQSQGIIKDVNDSQSVAAFLKGTARVSKKISGEFLSKKGNESVLEAFMNTYNFKGKRVDEALRELLEGFRLPGESALIERIITSFSEHYCAGSTSDGIANSDAVFVLTYAILMLNTDSYNPNLKAAARMTLDQFSNNLRGVNGGKNFDPQYLKDVYNSIKADEIILPDEHDNKHAFDYAWRELLSKTEAAGKLIICDTNIFDADMFEATWRPIVATLSYVFISASDDTVVSRIIAGFDQCAQIAIKYGLIEVIDQVIYCLSHITTLATEIPSSTALNTEIQAGESSVMVSGLSVRFGRDFKAQLATVVLFRILNGGEALISESWKHVVDIWVNLFVNSLMPSFWVPNGMEISTIPLQTSLQVVDRGQKTGDTGLFSVFTSYISSYAADDPPEPSDEEMESTLCTVDCINACHMNDVFFNILKLPVTSLKPLVKALLDKLPDDPSAVMLNVKSETESVAPVYQKSFNSGLAYDPSIVYLSEMSTTLALQSEETLIALGSDVSSALLNILRNASSYHWILVSRVVLYLLHLLHASHELNFIRVPVVLHLIASLKKDLFEKSTSLVLQGLHLCIKEPGPLRNEIMTSPDFWFILRNMAGNSSSAPTVFEILEGVIIGSPPSIMADNYESAVNLLNDFASAGSIGAAVEQKQEKKSRRGPIPANPKKHDKVRIEAALSRGVKAITMIFSLTDRILVLMQQSHLEPRKAWTAYWSPIFNALTTQCTNPCREIRHQAFSSLQHTLLSPQLTHDSESQDEWIAIFGEVLFPLIFRLLKPEVYSSDPTGMSETRVQAATLLCRIFLHYLALLYKYDGMLDLWLRILDLMDRLMNSGQGDSLEEAVPESLKNIILVMSNCNFLELPHQAVDEREDKLWSETWKRIDRFLPNLRKELDLDSKETNKPFQSTVTTELAENQKTIMEM
ncbi:guanine nucleotide exchange factor [Blumeria hordei DH14]|uniref:Guanine nucleotide exchange factor n=1 Tax=Blumeria graminis f. sp. hordei (strain DH14) TaxID=546991 RepID=N1JDK0_BLUG1|nr:guanine nucleotide exchange factor [Blumeria hordei DH14]